MFYVKQLQLAVIVGAGPPFPPPLHHFDPIHLFILHFHLPPPFRSPPPHLLHSCSTGRGTSRRWRGRQRSRSRTAGSRSSSPRSPCPPRHSGWSEAEAEPPGRWTWTGPRSALSPESAPPKESERSRRSMNDRLSCTHGWKTAIQ